MKTICSDHEYYGFWKATRVDVFVFEIRLCVCAYVRACVRSCLIKIDFEVCFFKRNSYPTSECCCRCRIYTVEIIFRQYKHIIFTFSANRTQSTENTEKHSYSEKLLRPTALFIPFDYLNTIANRIGICLKRLRT